MNNNDKINVVLVTIGSYEEAKKLVSTLVTESFIACGNILPGITSIYSWKGQIQESSECLIIMKSPQKNSETLMKRIKELHPYEVPEIIILNPHSVHEDYRKWVLNPGE